MVQSKGTIRKNLDIHVVIDRDWCTTSTSAFPAMPSLELARKEETQAPCSERHAIDKFWPQLLLLEDECRDLVHVVCEATRNMSPRQRRSRAPMSCPDGVWWAWCLYLPSSTTHSGGHHRGPAERERVVGGVVLIIGDEGDAMSSTRSYRLL
uniref:Uncharacterized protein n=1 Tax=Oryza sativa subsp. japonica TaxID=39947 RepID=Q6K5Q9_ORYSJ|nr:hypothetical protein [Oryza sativa Japonica Group]BAD22066.1 hypothetical protein [Oryza sativa Japonica Group]